MKKVFRIMALCTVLGTLAVSCQKEQMSTPQNTVAEDAAVYTLSYYVDGTFYAVTLQGEQALDEFLRNLFALANEGHKVSVRSGNAGNQILSSKEAVVYTTTNEDDAKNWAKAMIKQGYVVDIEFDSKSGIYTCTAVK